MASVGSSSNNASAGCAPEPLLRYAAALSRGSADPLARLCRFVNALGQPKHRVKAFKEQDSAWFQLYHEHHARVVREFGEVFLVDISRLDAKAVHAIRERLGVQRGCLNASTIGRWIRPLNSAAYGHSHTFA